MRLFISYLRDPGTSDGPSWQTLEPQRRMVADYLKGGRSEILGEYVEIESGKGDDRPELRRAIDHARRTGAVLLIAKLDTLFRESRFITDLDQAGVEFVAVDMPEVNRLTVHIMSVLRGIQHKLDRAFDDLSEIKVRVSAIDEFILDVNEANSQEGTR